MSDLANADLGRVPTAGGSVRVTIPGTPFQVQANAGTSLACKQVWIVAAVGNTNEIRVNIGAACTASTGIPVPRSFFDGTTEAASWQALNVPIDDVSSLYFIGASENDVVDILYTK